MIFQNHRHPKKREWFGNKPAEILSSARLLRARGILILSVLAMCGFFPQTVSAQKKAAQPEIKKEQIEAAFIYNFAKFVDWPAASFTNSTSPYVIGVLGTNTFVSALESTVGKQQINGRKIEIHLVAAPDDIGVCHILFISTGEKLEAADKVRLKDTFAKIRGRSILTVGEAGRENEGFAGCGGIVNFYTIGDKVRFEINPDAAERADLKISSKLLNLAQIVRENPPQ